MRRLRIVLTAGIFSVTFGCAGHVEKTPAGGGGADIPREEEGNVVQSTTEQESVPVPMADVSGYIFEFEGSYYDYIWKTKSGSGCVVARFGFVNRSANSIRIRGCLLRDRADDPQDPRRFPLIIEDSNLLVDGASLPPYKKDWFCEKGVVDLLPGGEYTIDIPACSLGSNSSGDGGGAVVRGESAAFASAPFPIRELVDAFPENRKYPDNGDLPIPQENRAVMPVEAVEAYMCFGHSSSVEFDRRTYFRPTGDEILAANRAILQYLLTPESRAKLNVPFDTRRGDRILDRLDQYRVQYWGTSTPDGSRRRVEAQFFFSSNLWLQGESEFAAWKESIVSVKGGGVDFWGASFDLESGELLAIHVNSSK